MDSSHNERLQQAILAVVDKQISEADPPETATTYNRLQSEGHSPEEAKKLIGFVVGSVFFSVVRKGAKFDGANFVRLLNALPKPPWEIDAGVE